MFFFSGMKLFSEVLPSFNYEEFYLLIHLSALVFPLRGIFRKGALPFMTNRGEFPSLSVIITNEGIKSAFCYYGLPNS